MKTLLFATHNSNKLQEVAPLLADLYTLKLPKDFGILRELPEDFDTLEANAVQKAQFVYTATGLDTFADDTGLEVEILGGAPGPFSARYAGPEGDAQNNMRKLLEQMVGKSHRKARFRTIIALILGGEVRLFEGVVDGEILHEQQGEGGFGYDPIFRPYGYQQSLAEMPLAQKNSLSHRANALKAMRTYLESL